MQVVDVKAQPSSVRLGRRDHRGAMPDIVALGSTDKMERVVAQAGVVGFNATIPNTQALSLFESSVSQRSAHRMRV
jgi:hypothetical protein